MSALDVISVRQAKKWLNVDFDEDDELIENIIKAAVDYVERYTYYRLYQRTETVTSLGYETSLYQYPLSVTGAVDSKGAEVKYTFKQGVNRVYLYAPCGTVFTLNTGYATADDAAPALLQGAYKLITYMYENRDLYPVNMPTDFQMIVNPYRRRLCL